MTKIDFSKLAEEFINNPDSPVGLRFQSFANKMMTPPKEVDALLSALVDYKREPTDSNKSSVDACILDWEKMNGPNEPLQMTPDMLSSFKEQAEDIIKSEQRQPPPIDSILELEAIPTDYEYDIAGTFGGIKGVWHTFWAAISSEYTFTAIIPNQAETYSELVKTIRKEFEELLGREMTQPEFDALSVHAMRNSELEGQPALKETVERNRND